MAWPVFGDKVRIKISHSISLYERQMSSFHRTVEYVLKLRIINRCPRVRIRIIIQQKQKQRLDSFCLFNKGYVVCIVGLSPNMTSLTKGLGRFSPGSSRERGGLRVAGKQPSMISRCASCVHALRSMVFSGRRKYSSLRPPRWSEVQALC